MNTSIKTYYSFISGIILLCAFSLVSAAPSPAVLFSLSDVQPNFNFSFSNSAGGFVLGYKFHVNTPITVTSLGVYDGGQSNGAGSTTTPVSNGFVNEHPVGLYDSVGNLLRTTTIQIGTVNTLVGAFRYADVSPITLGIGDYVLVDVAGYSPGNPVDVYTRDPNNIGFDPRISYIDNRVLGGTGNTLQFLNDSDTEHAPGFNYGWFGPNMLVSNVPEPATTLLLLSMGGAAMIRKLRMKKKS